MRTNVRVCVCVCVFSFYTVYTLLPNNTIVRITSPSVPTRANSSSLSLRRREKGGGCSPISRRKVYISFRLDRSPSSRSLLLFSLFRKSPRLQSTRCAPSPVPRVPQKARDRLERSSIGLSVGRSNRARFVETRGNSKARRISRPASVDAIEPIRAVSVSLKHLKHRKNKGSQCGLDSR